MPSLTILDRLLKQLRFDENKKKISAAYLKYQTWFENKEKRIQFQTNFLYLYRYVDLLQMVQPDYSQDHIIMLLLKEMEEFTDVNYFLLFEKNNLIIFFFSRVINLRLFDFELF